MHERVQIVRSYARLYGNASTRRSIGRPKPPIMYRSGFQREHVQIYIMHIITGMVPVHVSINIPVLCVQITQIPTDARDASLYEFFPRARLRVLRMSRLCWLSLSCSKRCDDCLCLKMT